MDNVTMTAEQLGVTFRDLPSPEVVSVRRWVGTDREQYLGRLIRSESDGPVWADEDLQAHLGGPLTIEGQMRGARARCLFMLRDRDREAGMRDTDIEDRKPVAYGVPVGSYGWALERIKLGKRVYRRGWNGKRMWIYLVVFSQYSGLNLAFKPCIAMHTARGHEQPGWLASQDDMLSEDWEEHES